jgi:hypothetical protein
MRLVRVKEWALQLLALLRLVQEFQMLQLLELVLETQVNKLTLGH